ncbi:MAG TPA: nucleoside recognition family protein [Desulfuromonadales bacterium]|nr:nucleoside recognition family protein [Desulfuromonadales bacterium]
MEDVIKVMLQSGKSAIELALYILLPVLVIMMALMKVVEAKGLLALVARLLQPLLRLFGVPGAGVFAMLQLLLVSFAAPLATLSIMEKDDTSRRQIAATLAMVLAMSQANAVYPLVAVGLNLPVIMATSVAGGLIAAACTYYLFARAVDGNEQGGGESALPSAEKNRSVSLLNLMISGGQEAVQVIIGAIPLLILAIFAVNLLKVSGAISYLETFLAPLFGLIGVPPVAVLPIATKYLAGGTAMMGVTLNLVKEGAINALQLNRMAGFIINPCDIVGVAVLVSAGNRCSSVVKPAIAGAFVGIVIRGVLHLLIF